MADTEGEENKFDIKKLYALPRPRKLLAMVLGEFVGTFLLVLLGCMTVIGPEEYLQVLAIAAGWGFVVGHIVLVFGPISGAHVNPAITTANIILGSMSPLLALIYYFCQFMGSILGILVLKVIISKKFWEESKLQGNGVCVTFPHDIVTPVQAMFIEFFATSFLVLIVCTAHDHRTQHHRDSFELKVAGVIICDVICIADLTCASLNTARTFGPALINNFWKDHWVYWVGPIMAGIVTPIVYLLLWMPKKRPLALDVTMVQKLFVEEPDYVIMAIDVKKCFALPSTRKLIAIILSEGVGTLLLEFFGCLTLLGELNLLTVAFGWGFVIGHLVLLFRPISGGHFNPSITTAALIMGTVSPLLATIYIVCQFVGAIIGVLLMKLLISKELWDLSMIQGHGVCISKPFSEISDWQAALIEFFGTSFLVLIVCSAHDRRSDFHRDAFEVKVAGVLICIIICLGDLTSASLNTARTFAPALLQSYWDSQWVYWVGPWSAGIIVPIIYMLIWMPKPREEGFNMDKYFSLVVAIHKGPDNEGLDEYQ